jgi:hypothetical protein
VILIQHVKRHLVCNTWGGSLFYLFIYLFMCFYLFIYLCVYIYLFILYFARQPPVDHSLLNHEVSMSHTRMHHSRKDSSGRVIRPLPDNTQHLQQTSMPPVAFEPTVSAGKQLQTFAPDRAVPGIGGRKFIVLLIKGCRLGYEMIPILEI